MAMASPTEVSNLTGVHVGESDIVRAQGIITLFSGRSEAAYNLMRKRDRYWYKMAVAYQTAWMASHPEVFSTMDVASLTQVDLSVTFRAEDNQAMLIAPLARKALARVSWKGTRSIKMATDFQDPVPEDVEAWEPM